MKLANFGLVLLLLLATHAADAAVAVVPRSTSSTEPRFEVVGSGSIPRDVVPTFVQDKAGYFWIATGDGLVRFDGYHFRPQELNTADPTKRNLGWIRALLAGADGNVWIGTESSGLAVYEATTDKVRLVGDRVNSVSPHLPLPTIRALAQDAAGRVYAGSIGSGIEVFDPKNSSMSSLRQSGQAGELPDNRVQALLVDRAQNLWAGTWAGLSLRRGQGNGFTRVTLPDAGGATPVVQALAQASDGRVWAGTQSGALYVVDPATLTVRMLVSGTAGRPPVTSFVEDDDSRMWVGSSGGLDLFDVERLEHVRHIAHDIRKPAGLAGDDITTLLRDRAGWLWVGGFGLGLQRHNPNNKAISLRAPDLEAGSPYHGSDIRSIVQLDNGEVWASMHGDSIVVFDQALRATGTLAPASKGKVAAMVQRTDGTVWLGADSELLVFDTRHRPVRTLKVPTGPIRRLFESRDGALWIGTQDGVCQLQRGATQVNRLRQSAGDLNGEVHVFAQGPDDAVWAGTTGGLFRIEPGTSLLRPVSSPVDHGLASPIVIGLLFDDKGTLWVDTGVAGLHRMVSWDGGLARFDRVSYRHGLIGKPFGANLLADSQGRIWTQMGVYDPKLDKLHELTSVDGADLGTGWFYSYAATNDGRLLFGGSKGILVVSPEQYSETAFSAPVVVTDLRINGERKDYGAAYPEVVIAPDDRSFSVEFAALDFIEPSSLRYSYRLQGFEDDWVSTGSDFRFASYSNLSPGRYTLQVRAANRSGDWSVNELIIPVHKIAAWWQTGWFMALCVAGAVLCVMGLVRLRTYQLHVRQRELETKVHERTTELESLNLELQLQSEALAESSLVDPLTGLHNRRFFAQQIDGDLSLAQRALEERNPTAPGPEWTGDLVFFLFDIDHFKLVNDTYGHAVGDEVLIQVSERIRSIFRDSDYLVRWGGEEFLGVARQTSRSKAGELAERARMAIAGNFFETQSGMRLQVTVSVGFSAYPLSMQQPRALGWEELVKLADSALYFVKTNGRDGWLGVTDCDDMAADDIRNLVKRPLVEVMQLGLIGFECSSTVLAGLNTSG